MDEFRRLKVFSGTASQIEERASNWMGENEGKVDVIEQKLKFGRHNGYTHYNPTGVLSIIYRRYRD